MTQPDNVPYVFKSGKVALEHPRGWECEEAGSTVVFLDPAAGDWALQVVLIDGAEPPADGQVLSEAALVGFVRQQHHTEITAHDVRTRLIADAYASEYSLVTHADTGDVHWRVWALSRGPFVVLLAHVSSPDTSRDCRDAVVEVVESTRILGRLPPTREEFQQRVFQRVAAALPSTTLERGPGFAVTAGRVKVNLEALYREMLADAEREAAVTQRAASLCIAGLPGPLSGRVSWADARAKLFPALISLDALDDGVAYTSLVDVAAVVYRHEGDLTATLAQTADMEAWGVTTEELHAAAIANLDAGPVAEMESMEGEDGGIALTCTSFDGLAATRVLLPLFYDSIKEHLGEEFLVCIPGRDLLVAFSSAPPAFRENILSQLREQTAALSRPITRAVLRFSAGGLERAGEL